MSNNFGMGGEVLEDLVVQWGTAVVFAPLPLDHLSLKRGVDINGGHRNHWPDAFGITRHADHFSQGQ